MPFHSPYDPEACTDEFGWLWCDTDGDGRRWNMVNAFYSVGGDLSVMFMRSGADPETYFIDDAEPYRGMPYIPITAPHLSPDQMGD